jgi:hypothetical protein
MDLTGLAPSKRFAGSSTPLGPWLTNSDWAIAGVKLDGAVVAPERAIVAETPSGTDPL